MNIQQESMVHTVCALRQSYTRHKGELSETIPSCKGGIGISKYVEQLSHRVITFMMCWLYYV